MTDSEWKDPLVAKLAEEHPDALRGIALHAPAAAVLWYVAGIPARSKAADFLRDLIDAELRRNRPEFRWQNNGEAGDGQMVCTECGAEEDHEADRPHTYRDCLTNIREADRQAADLVREHEQQRDAELREGREYRWRPGAEAERGSRRRVVVYFSAIRQERGMREEDVYRMAQLEDHAGLLWFPLPEMEENHG